MLIDAWHYNVINNKNAQLGVKFPTFWNILRRSTLEEYSMNVYQKNNEKPYITIYIAIYSFISSIR